jgi:hypothetical protein
MSIAFALSTWGDALRGSTVWVWCDCMPVVQAFRKLSSPDPSLMQLIRFLVMITIKKQIVVKIGHLGTEENKLADAISRLELAQFKTLHPTANRTKDKEIEPELELPSW